MALLGAEFVKIRILQVLDNPTLKPPPENFYSRRSTGYDVPIPIKHDKVQCHGVVCGCRG